MQSANKRGLALLLCLCLSLPLLAARGSSGATDAAPTPAADAVFEAVGFTPIA